MDNRQGRRCLGDGILDYSMYTSKVDVFAGLTTGLWTALAGVNAARTDQLVT